MLLGVQGTKKIINVFLGPFMKRSLSDLDMAELRCTFLIAARFQSWFTWGWFTEILLYVSTEKGSQLGRATQPSSKLGVKGRAMTGADFYPAHIRKSPGTKTHGKTEPSLIRIIILLSPIQYLVLSLEVLIYY